MRGLGLMVGIVVDAEQRAEIVAEIMDKGVLVLTAGTNVIRLRRRSPFRMRKWMKRSL